MSKKKLSSEKGRFSRRKILGKVGVLGAGSFALPGIASATPEKEDSKNKKEKEDSKNKKENSNLPVPEDEVVYADEMEPFNPDAKQVPMDQLPLSSESISGNSSDGEVSTMASGSCYGTGVKFLDVQVCLNDDGSFEASVGALGVVADSLVISPGEANRSGYVTTSIPGLPGTVQEFSSSWTVEWSGTTVEKVSVQATVEAWEFGVGWYQIASIDTVLID